MTWNPINPSHAIERVRFVMKFRENVPAKLSRQMGDVVSRLRSEVRLDGPIPVNLLNFAFQVGSDGKPVLANQASSAQGQGWQFSRGSSNGSPIELIAVTGDQLIYETAEYRRWGTFRQRFEKIVSPVINLAAPMLDIEFISLEYFDRFFFLMVPKVPQTRPLCCLDWSIVCILTR